ncbi:hypothetical protein K438DRAFT_1942134, partial [Mycena galopus ATCC 62051]
MPPLLSFLALSLLVILAVASDFLFGKLEISFFGRADLDFVSFILGRFCDELLSAPGDTSWMWDACAPVFYDFPVFFIRDPKSSLQPLCKLHEPNHGITDSLPIALSSTVFPLTNSYLRTSPLRLDLPTKLRRTPLDLRVCYIKEIRAGGSWFLVRSPPPFSIPIALLLDKVVKREGRRTAYRARSANRQIIRLISKDITQTRCCMHLSSISPSSQGCSKERDLRSDLKHLKGLESTDLHQIPCTLSSCDNRAVLYLRVSLASAPRARCTRAQYCADSTFILCCAKSSRNS